MERSGAASSARFIALAALVAAVLVLGTVAASAQTTSTTPPRTTAPTVSPQASSFPVLQRDDLPSGYQMGTGSPFQASSQSPTYPTIDKCVWSFTNRFSGLTPDIYQTTFQQQTPVSGLDIAIVFDAEKPATAYYDDIEKPHLAAQKCTTTKSPSSTGTGLSTYGKVTPLAVGKLGDASFGVTITPPSKTFPPIKYAVARTGNTVVQLRVIDPDMSLSEFKALAETAVERAS